MKKIIVVCFFSLLGLVGQCCAAGKHESKGAVDLDPWHFNPADLYSSPEGLYQGLYGDFEYEAPQAIKEDYVLPVVVDPIEQQAALRTRIDSDYNRFLAESVRLWEGSGLTHNTVKYLDYLTRILKVNKGFGAAEAVAEEIQGVLHGALDGFPALALEEKGRAQDRETIIKAFLATEIVRNLNTWGAYGTEDPRYDMEGPRLWNAMNPSKPKSPEQLYILTAISLATQEQLWNPQSTPKNLQDHVRDFWPGNLSHEDLNQRDRIIGAYINSDLMNWVREMKGLFSVRVQQKAELKNYEAQRPGMVVTKVNNGKLELFLKPGEVLGHYLSAGRRNQCGFFSTFFQDNSDRGGLSARQEFFSLVSHDLENPFTAKVFVNKVINAGDVIADTLREARDSAERKADLKIEDSAVFKSLEAESRRVALSLKEIERKEFETKYQKIKMETLESVRRILQEYVDASRIVGLSDAPAPHKSHEYLVVDVRFAEKIRGLVALLLKNITAIPSVDTFKADEVINARGNVIRDLLSNVRENSVNGNAALANEVIAKMVHFERLTPYESKLEYDDHYHKELKGKALTNIVNILQGYIARSKDAWQARARAVQQAIDLGLAYAQGTAEIDNQISAFATEATARISAEIAPLVQHLFRALGVLPFRENIEKIRKAFQYEFIGPERLAQGNVADAELELTFRQAGTVQEPFTASYPYSDPVDGLVISNQNVFGWVGNYVFMNDFYRQGSTLSEFKKFAQSLVDRLRINPEELKERERVMAALPGELNNFMRLSMQGDNAKPQSDYILLVARYLRLEDKMKRSIKSIQDQTEVMRKNVKWWRDNVEIISATGLPPTDSADVLRLNEEINDLINDKNIANLGPKLAEAFDRIKNIFSVEHQKSYVDAGKIVSSSTADLLKSLDEMKSILDLEGKENEKIKEKMPKDEKEQKERQRLSDQVDHIILRTKWSVDRFVPDSDLDRAFLPIMESDRRVREQMIGELNLGVVIDAARAVGYPVGVDPETDRQTAVWWLNQIRKNLIKYAVPLAVAESGGVHYYLMDVILATDAEGKNTARNTHLFNESGVHYEKLVPTPAPSLTSVAKAIRHMEKYNLSGGRIVLASQDTLADTFKASQKASSVGGKEYKEGKLPEKPKDEGVTTGGSAPGTSPANVSGVVGVSASGASPSLSASTTPVLGTAVTSASSASSSPAEDEDEWVVDPDDLAAARALSMGASTTASAPSSVSGGA